MCYKELEDDSTRPRKVEEVTRGGQDSANDDYHHLYHHHELF